MTLGLGVLRLDPRGFWLMTLPEFAAAARAVTGLTSTAGDAPTRQNLAALLSRFPDHNTLQETT